ncbi:MAG TPA: TonB-dependent receptor [Rhodopila sp.]|nr:TonB-dependent receptor [Rhodopila sp.]
MRLWHGAVALTLVSVTAAKADDAPLTAPETVVTATRVPTPIEEIAAGVTVIDRAMIETRGYNSLTQALNDVPGVHVSPSGGLGGQASVFIRGSNSDHVLVLRDGMPINDASDPTAAFNFGTDTLSDIERIEIIRGPMAALYGSGAIGGVINLISRRGTQEGVHWEGDLSAGYPALGRGAVSASGIEGPVDFALTAQAQGQTGYDYIPQREQAYTGSAQGFNNRILTMNLGYTPVEGTRLSLFLRAAGAYFGNDSFSGPDPSGNVETNVSDTSVLGRIGGTTHLFDGMLETGVFVGQLQDDRGYITPFSPDNTSQISGDDRYHSYQTDVQWNNTLHLPVLPGLSDSALTFGYEYTGDTAKVRTNDVYPGSTFAESVAASMTDNAAYLGLQTTVLQRLVLTGQVRQDWVVNDAPTTWRLGGVYDLKEIATHLKLSYGTAFRAPSLYDRYGNYASNYGGAIFNYVGNPNLRPEQSKSWEVGFTTDIPGAGRSDMVTFGATYFDERVTDLIEYATISATTESEINVDSAHMHGVELEAFLHPARWMDVHAEYTLLNTNSVGQPAGQTQQLLNRPQNQASGTVTVRPLERLQISTTLVYTGTSYQYLYDNSGNALSPPGVGQHGLVANAAVNYTLTPRVELYSTAFNLFYSKFEPVNGFQMPGPTVVAGVRIRL